MSVFEMVLFEDSFPCFLQERGQCWQIFHFKDVLVALKIVLFEGKSTQMFHFTKPGTHAHAEGKGTCPSDQPGHV